MIKRYLKHLFLTAEKNNLRNIHQGISHLNVDKFMDIGCYDGSTTIEMGKIVHAKEISGIELDPKGIKLSTSKGIKVFRQDVNQDIWRIKDNSLDFISASQIIEHLYSVDNFIINIKRVLKKNHYALIATENLASWHNCFSLLLGFQPFSTTNLCMRKWSIGNPFIMTSYKGHDPLLIHRSVFTYHALEIFLKLYNFEIVKPIVSGYYPFPNKIGNWLAKIDKKHAVYMAFLVKNIK